MTAQLAAKASPTQPTGQTLPGGLKVGDRVAFSYVPDCWHEATVQDVCFSGRIQIIDDNERTHTFWPEQLRISPTSKETTMTDRFEPLLNQYKQTLPPQDQPAPQAEALAKERELLTALPIGLLVEARNFREGLLLGQRLAANNWHQKNMLRALLGLDGQALVAAYLDLGRTALAERTALVERTQAYAQEVRGWAASVRELVHADMPTWLREDLDDDAREIELLADAVTREAQREAAKADVSFYLFSALGQRNRSEARDIKARAEELARRFPKSPRR